jgi:hypothetical protein
MSHRFGHKKNSMQNKTTNATEIELGNVLDKAIQYVLKVQGKLVQLGMSCQSLVRQLVI